MPSQSIFMQVMEVIQSLIVELHLTGIPDANVLIMKVPRDLERDLPATTPFPCILIAPIGVEDMSRSGGTNTESDIGLPIQVVMLDMDNQDQEANFDRNLLWRQLIINKLNDRRPPGIPEIRRLSVSPGSIIDPGGWTRGKYISGIRVTADTRQARIL